MCQKRSKIGASVIEKKKPKKNTLEKTPKWKISDIADYTPITNYYTQFVEAEWRGRKNINLLYVKIFDELKGKKPKYKEMTELAMVIYDRICNSKYQTVYIKKFRALYDYAHCRLNGDRVKYFDYYTEGLSLTA